MKISYRVLIFFLSSSIFLEMGPEISALAPTSQADQNLLNQFDVNSFLQDGFAYYREPGINRVLWFVLGRFQDYYQIEIFDLSNKERVGYVDFHINRYQTSKILTASLVTALMVWFKRTYSPGALEAARKLGIDLEDIKGNHQIRKDAPVDPEPAIHIKKDFTRMGSLGWHHLGDILMGLTLFICDREGVHHIGISAEEGLHRRRFYERRYGALPLKGWYQELHPGAYRRLGQVELNEMVLDFNDGRFYPALRNHAYPNAMDVFVESITPLQDSDLSEIDIETRARQFPDRHVWSLLKSMAELLGPQGHVWLRAVLQQSLKTLGKKKILLPLPLSDLPEKWTNAVWILLEKEIVDLKPDARDLPILMNPIAGHEQIPIAPSGQELTYWDLSS